MNQETANNFFDAMDTIARDEAARLARDKTIEANIVRVNNVDTGEYTVEDEGSNYIAYSTSPDVKFHVGDRVYVIIPQGDYNLRKIIIGLSKSNMSAADVANLSQIPVPRGPNWISRANTPDDGGLYHYNRPTPPDYPAVGENSANGIDPAYKIYSWPLHITVGVTRPATPEPTWNAAGNVSYNDFAPWFTDVGFAISVNDETANDAIFQTYAKLYDKVLIRAKFKTLFAAPHDQGRYMLVAICEENIKDTAGNVVDRRYKHLELGYASFVGNPYAFNEWAAQEVVLTVSPDSLVGLRAVYLTQNWNTAPNTPSWTVDYRTDYDAAGNPTQVQNTTVPNVICDDIWISFCEMVDFREEIYRLFINTPKGNDLIPGLAPLPLKGSLLYKGEEILDISTSICTWYRENLYIQFGSSQFDKLGGARWELIGGAKYNEVFGEIDVPRWANPPTNSIEEVPWQRNYKLVVVYNNKITLDAIQTINNSNSAYDFEIQVETSDDNRTTYLRAVNRNSPNTNYWCDWWLELEDGAYTLLTAAGRQQGRFDNNNGVNEWLHNPMARFYCAVASAQARPANPNDNVIANLEYTFTAALDESDLFVEWIGKDFYTYDASGNLKFEDSNYERTLYANLKWATGKLSAYRIEIIAPDGIVMAPRAANSEGYAPTNSMMYDSWLGNFIDGGVNPNANNNVIHYHVRQKYDDAKTANTWILRVHTADNKTYDFPKEIVFTKDGNQGTNGGQYNVQLRPIRGKVAPANTTTPLEDPQPLRYSGGWTVNDYWRLYLRPFVYRKGTLIENFANLTYTAHYDVRMPQNSAWPGASLLNIYNYQSGAAVGTQMTNVPGATDYAAIEIRGNGNPTSLLSGSRCAFVKCQVDIEENGVLVATVYDVYGVDIYEGTNTQLNKLAVKTNWPKYVMYNSAGYEPQVFEEPLFFDYYSETAAQGGVGVGAAYNAETFAPTNNIQRIVEDPAGSGKYYYQPRDYFWWREGYTGVLRTTTVAAPLNGTYYRTISFYLNAFGNTDINGWDGQGIDINEANGTLFAPTVGAGYKEPASNLFTGVIMGMDKSQPIEVNSSFGSPNLFAGINAADYKASHPYQVGVFGYQRGIASYGLLENGTAFFGRADRGGRIIIDGINGTIYGGYRGISQGSTTNGGVLTATMFPMWDRMRLTLADLYSSGNTDDYTVDGATFANQYFPSNEYPDWYRAYLYAWNNNLSLNQTQPGNNGSGTSPVTVGSNNQQGPGLLFGANVRSHSTPAIEIGQHPPGSKPPELPRSWYSWIMNNLKIPGDRNFLITYDGALWAQNGFFQGNVVATNIWGSKIVSASGEWSVDGSMKIGAPWVYWSANSGGRGTINWGNFSVQEPYWYGTSGGGGGGQQIPAAFYVAPDGETWIKNLHIGQGGNNSTFDAGSVHIDADGMLIGGSGYDQRFSVIGETNLWGNVGVLGDYVSSRFVAVGEFYAGAPDVSGAIGNATPQNSIISLYSRTATKAEGNWHPMHFHSGNIGSGQWQQNWMTTMSFYMGDATSIPLCYSSTPATAFFRVGGSYGVNAQVLGFLEGQVDQEAQASAPKAVIGNLTRVTISSASGYGFATANGVGGMFLADTFVKMFTKTGAIYVGSKSSNAGFPSATGGLMLGDNSNNAVAAAGNGDGRFGSAGGALATDLLVKTGMWTHAATAQFGVAASANNAGTLKAGMSVGDNEVDIGTGGAASGPPVSFTAGMHIDGGSRTVKVAGALILLEKASDIHATGAPSIGIERNFAWMSGAESGGTVRVTDTTAWIGATNEPGQKGFLFKSDGIYLQGYTAEQQYQIYARFG